MSEGSTPSLISSTWRRRVTVAAAAGILLLALVETVSALVAPALAPSEADWKAAAAEVRGAFQPGDLVVAAPAWADQVMRMHLGDLVPLAAAARLDEGRFARVWEISQRGATAPEAEGGRLLRRAEHGALTLRLHERAALPVTYDFYDRWAEARVFLSGPGGEKTPCAPGADRHVCPGEASSVRPHLVEVGNRLRRGLHVPPPPGATAVVEYADVPLGRELAVGAGLHSVWLRRHGAGTVALRVLVDGQELGRIVSTNRSGWQVRRFDTARLLGKNAVVRFEVSADDTLHRHLGFAAEARGR